MIKKAQVKFICIIMSILLGFFLVIWAITNIVFNNINNKNIDHTLNEIVRFIPFVNQNTTINDSFIVKVYGVDAWEVVLVDSAVFPEETLTSTVNEIISRLNSSGRIGNVFYKTDIIKSVNYIVGIEASEAMTSLGVSKLRITLIFLAIYLTLCLIVYLFSFSVFEPIKESFEKQKQFVSNASHELKTPLTIISANADVLKQDQPSQWVNNIKDQTERLESIITDMLEMTKLDENKIKPTKQHFNLSEEIIKSTLPFDALAFEKGKTLDIDIPMDVTYYGDPDGTKKIMSILLDNAVKYASKDGLIRVNLNKKNGKLILSVYNTGSSVPANQANKIFERFYRFDNSRSRETGGSGLGLSIAKSIADANKWKISAISSPNEYMIINIVL